MQLRFAERTGRMRSSSIRSLLNVIEQEDVISLGGGLPSPACFPLDAIRKATHQILDGPNAVEALQYSPTEGYGPLREIITGIMKTRYIDTDPGSILITNGSQQALDLLAKIFIDPGDTVLVEEPTYLGALQAFNSYMPEYQTVRCDEEGMLPDSLERELKKTKARLIYLAPTYQNPTGRNMSWTRRREIMVVINRYDAILIEDDPYSEIYFNNKGSIPLKSVDSQDQTVYLSSFSKVLAPGLRLGWACASKPIIERMVQAKQGTDLNTGNLVQQVAASILSQNDFSNHLAMIRTQYKERRDSMIEALECYFPAECSFTRPNGGMFVWVKLDNYLDTADLLPTALSRGVAYVPGQAFFANTRVNNCMRLNYSCASREDITRAIKVLGEIIAEHGDHESRQFVI